AVGREVGKGEVAIVPAACTVVHSHIAACVVHERVVDGPVAVVVHVVADLRRGIARVAHPAEAAAVGVDAFPGPHARTAGHLATGRIRGGRGKTGDVQRGVVLIHEPVAVVVDAVADLWRRGPRVAGRPTAICL